jgi:hypothetical protein
MASVLERAIMRLCKEAPKDQSISFIITGVETLKYRATYTKSKAKSSSGFPAG